MDQTGLLRKEFSKWSGDFEYLCGLFCRVLEENEAGDVAAFIRCCFGGPSAEPDRDVAGGPIQLCQALSIAFQLPNQMRRRAGTPQRQSEPGLWLYSLADLAAHGFTEDQVRTALETVACEAVLTAHPTEDCRHRAHLDVTPVMRSAVRKTPPSVLGMGGGGGAKPCGVPRSGRD